MKYEKDGNFALTPGKVLALAYIDSDKISPGISIEAENLGNQYTSGIIPESPCDPKNLV